MTKTIDTSTSSKLPVVDAPTSVGQGISYDKFLDCVHCGLCTSACPTYLETGNENDSPRGRIYLMRGVVDGRIGLTDRVQRHLELCLDCRSCETACPSGVQYGRLIEPFRVDMSELSASENKSGPGWFQKYVLFGMFPYASRLRWALLPARIMQLLKLDTLAEVTGLTRLLPGPLRRMQRLLPKLYSNPPALPEVLPAKGERRARVALFTGCVAEGVFPHTNRATARVLQENGCEVVVPPNQACCGAIHYHGGAGEQSLQFLSQNVHAFDNDDLDAIIINVAGCGSMLKDYGHIGHELLEADDPNIAGLEQFASKVKDVSEFLDELGLIPPTGNINLKATYHDACHLCHAQQVRSQPRNLLAQIPGLELVLLGESEICCGAAGSYNLTEPEMADRLAHRKVTNILRTGAEAVIMGNAGCSLQIQAALRQAGEPIPVLHPVDLLDASYQHANIGTL